MDAAAPGIDSAVAQAHRAVRIRRIGAALTDAGLVMGAAGAIGALSRAVWWHNLRFGR